MSKRRVLITGASKGIGRAVADRVAASGHEPIGLARTAPSEFPEDAGYVTGQIVRVEGGGSIPAA
jgi:nucleoside-diphosphate-sugar epimerase